jgi:hypothetical protein
MGPEDIAVNIYSYCACPEVSINIFATRVCPFRLRTTLASEPFANSLDKYRIRSCSKALSFLQRARRSVDRVSRICLSLSLPQPRRQSNDETHFPKTLVVLRSVLSTAIGISPCQLHEGKRAKEC